MTKKIELHPTLAINFLYSKLWQFTNSNSISSNGSCKLYLMGGDIPINEDGFYPKTFNLTMPYVDGPYPVDAGFEGMWSRIVSFTPGTYTTTVTSGGQTITASVDVSSNLVDNFQILNRSGNKNLGIQSIIFPFQIPTLINSDGQTGNVLTDIPATIMPTVVSPLVTWKNNRVKANSNANLTSVSAEDIWLSTYAAAATNSGVATWFCGINTGYNLWFVGNVGLTGSGADLELDDVNIVQGKTYGISNLRFQMPTSFTY